jgi:drug/metabolite transporter (DMT)-like permease
MTHRRAVVILLACTFIWGASFALNKIALAFVSPMLFLAVRFTISALLLGPQYLKVTREDWKAGAALGILFGVQLAFFAGGLALSPPARAAFLFSATTPLVPVLMMLLNRRPPSSRDVIAVGVAVAGSWLLTRPADALGGLSRGDLLMLASAVFAAFYVVAAGHLAPKHDSLRLLAVQFVAMAGLGAVFSLLLEAPRLDLNLTTVVLIPFLALSSIATFGGQLLGQKLIRPTEAALIYALEPVAAAATSFVAIGERLAAGQWLGGGLILIAALLVVRWKREVALPAAVAESAAAPPS